MKIPYTILKKIKGFGLIEVLISTVVLGVGLVGVAQFQGNVYKDGSLSKQRAEALIIAEKKLEELRHFSTISEYENNFTSSLSGIQTVENTTINRDTTTFTLKAYVKPDATGRSTDISVQVTWPDQTDSGNVTDDTTVQLSTIVSTNTPASLALTDIAPVPDSSDNPEVPDVSIEITPGDPTLDASNPDACECSTTTTTTTTSALDPNWFGMGDYRKVGMGMMGGGGGGTTTVTTTTTVNGSRSSECDECCTNAGGDWASVANTDTMYADLAKDLEKFLRKEISSYKKTRLEDQVIGQNSFNPAFLQKGYKTQNNLLNNTIKKTGMGMMGGGGGGSTTTTTTETNYALCSWVKETVTTTTTTNTSRRFRGMMGNWRQ